MENVWMQRCLLCMKPGTVHVSLWSMGDRASISFISASDLNFHHPDWSRPFTQETQIQIKWLLTLKCLKNCLCICQSSSAIDGAVLKKLHLKNQWRGSRNSGTVNYKSFSIICGFFLSQFCLFLHLCFSLSVLSAAGAVQGLVDWGVC